MTNNQQQRAKRYEAIHNVLFLVETRLRVARCWRLPFSGRVGFSGRCGASAVSQPVDFDGAVRRGCHLWGEVSFPSAELVQRLFPRTPLWLVERNVWRLVVRRSQIARVESAARCHRARRRVLLPAAGG